MEGGTSIGLDHTEILGDTIEKIAGEKAGIIKKGVPVFFDGSDERSSRVIEETAENVEAPWYKMEKDALKIQEITDKHIAFSILDEYDNNTVWQVASTGIYQGDEIYIWRKGRNLQMAEGGCIC